MASLLSSVIVAACVGAHGNVHEACVKSLDAGTRQTGIRQNVDQIEDDFIRYINMRLANELSKEQQKVLGAAGFFFKVAKDQKINFRTPTLGVCDRIENELTPNSYLVRFGWYF